jgi:hypothetical protein
MKKKWYWEVIIGLILFLGLIGFIWLIGVGTRKQIEIRELQNESLRQQTLAHALDDPAVQREAAKRICDDGTLPFVARPGDDSYIRCYSRVLAKLATPTTFVPSP